MNQKTSYKKSFEFSLSIIDFYTGASVPPAPFLVLVPLVPAPMVLVAHRIWSKRTLEPALD